MTFDPINIDWGSLNKGDLVTRYVNITNNGDNPSKPLNMTYQPNDIGVVTWSNETVILAGHTWTNATFVLTSAINAPEGTFNLDLTISG